MNSSEIRSRFLKFFEKRGHAIIPSASLVTPDEKGVTNATLFNTAGMQPLVPFLLGKPFITANGQEVKRLVDVQKCLRTVDIDDIGDKTHATFFEMLGNWSLGDYFKKEAIEWSYEFLTSKSDIPGDQGLGLDPARLYVSVFEGDANAPRDDEASNIWREIFKKNGMDAGGDTSKGESGRIFYLPAEKNWWEAGENGPCGPDTEMFYDIMNKFGGKTLTHAEYIQADDARDVVEVWNDVFMQYEKKDGKIIGKLAKPSVDTGAGLERLAMTLQGVDNIYDTDLFKPVMLEIAKRDGWNTNPMNLENEKRFGYEKHLKSVRIIADHTKAAIFMIADGVIPSSTSRGYVLRKLIRRAVFHYTNINLQLMSHNLVSIIANNYKDTYPDLTNKQDYIHKIINEEELNFLKTLKDGLHELRKMAMDLFDKSADGQIIDPVLRLNGKNLFFIYSTYGFPFELSIEEINKIRKDFRRDYKYEILTEEEIQILRAEFQEEMKSHQSLSRAGAEQKFKGGLADANDPMVVRYHTATHLLHQALHDVLGEGVGQKGSNITAERLRFDFSWGAKMTDEQKKKVEDIVNEKIAEELPMNNIVMSRELAEKTGARHFFGEKYGDQISIYFIGNSSNPPVPDDLKNAYSKEFCGGPHVKNTKELAGPEGKWRFKIQKEEAVAQGIRRIKAVLV